MRGVRVWLCVCACWAAAAPAGLEAPRCAAGGSDTGTAAPGGRPRCAEIGPIYNEYEFSVCDKKIIIKMGESLEVRCKDERSLECPALPSYSSAVRVALVTLEGCAPPAGRPLALVLAALNVSLAAGARLALRGLPAAPPLASAHLAGLELLAGLTLAGADGARPAPAPGFLAPLRRLAALEVHRVRLPPGELAAPPPALARLVLRHAGLARPPAAATALTDLTLEAGVPLDDFPLPPRLRSLSLTSPAPALHLRDTASIETLLLSGWSERRPTPLARCASLRSLQLSRPAAEALPARWLAACARLERLVVAHARRLAAMPVDALAGAVALLHLTIIDTQLKALPAGWLTDATELRSLKLFNNKLLTISSAALAGPRALRSLDLSSNRLDARAAPALAALTALTELHLGGNHRLQDLCDSAHDYSPLVQLKNLKTLALNKSNVTRICRDWRENLTRLEMLDLQNTRVAELAFSELLYSRDEPVSCDVLLKGAPVRGVRASRADYERAAAAPTARARATLHLDASLACDCSLYWARLALALPVGAAHVRGLHCADGSALRDVDPDGLLCPAPECSALPSACACGWRPHAGAAPRLLRVSCAHAALRRVPRLPRDPATATDLLLPHNHIDRIHRDDLPPLLRELDLRNNSIEVIDEAVAGALAGVRRLRVGGNPLACDCRAQPLQRALRLSGGGADAACADGRALAGAACGAGAAGWLAGGAALAALAVGAGAAACLARPGRRRLARALLLRAGVLRRAPEPDEGRPYDAFVAFSHRDERVVHELVARLEGGPRPYRLCLHQRDWAPGRLIREQIAESVARSRRTLAVVSRHFLQSAWARAEFLEAYAAALRDASPRLVVVLLEAPAALPLGCELRRFVAVNTYVRWGDPWFWDKLYLALPPPRAPDAPLTSKPAPPAYEPAPLAGSQPAPLAGSQPAPPPEARALLGSHPASSLPV